VADRLQEDLFERVPPLAEVMDEQVLLVDDLPDDVEVDVRRQNDPPASSALPHALDSAGLQRGGEADEVAAAALYLASDASSFTTGAILKIDGGSR